MNKKSEIYLKINDEFIIAVPRDKRTEFLDDRYRERVEFVKSIITSDTKLEDMNKIFTKSCMYINSKYLGCTYKYFEFKEMSIDDWQMGNKISKMYNSTKNVKTLVDENDQLKNEIDYLKERMNKLEENLQKKNTAIDLFVKEMSGAVEKLEKEHKDFI